MGRHYAGQAVKQLYVLVLGLDVLGNPFGLLRGMAEGVEDLFYEPYQVCNNQCNEWINNRVVNNQSTESNDKVNIIKVLKGKEDFFNESYQVNTCTIFNKSTERYGGSYVPALFNI